MFYSACGLREAIDRFRRSLASRCPAEPINRSPTHLGKLPLKPYPVRPSYRPYILINSETVGLIHSGQETEIRYRHVATDSNVEHFKYSKQQINWHQTLNSRHSWQLLKFRPIRYTIMGQVCMHRMNRSPLLAAGAIFRSPAVFKPQALRMTDDDTYL